MRILKLGWEFPPNNYGGLGVACEGLVRGLTAAGLEILLVLPRYQSSTIARCQIIAAEKQLSTMPINVGFSSYCTSESYQEWYRNHSGAASLYGATIFTEVEHYAQAVANIVLQECFDIIHAHDWMSFKAGMLAKEITKKPLVVHIHATEFDRTGGNGVNEMVYNIERSGMIEADTVIAVSQFTKNKIIKHYAINADKISVVHNAITHDVVHYRDNCNNNQQPMVLFLGRLTLQKGPDYFITAAQKLLHYRPKVTFVIVGSGDMEEDLIQWVARAGMSDKILFTGQLRGADVDKMYRIASVFVMPSVSEPFGLTVLEAIQQGTPVIMSKQSGVSEVVRHALAVDFWDINELVNKIIAVLDHTVLQKMLAYNARQEVRALSWDKAAQQCIAVYKKCLYA